MIPFFADLVAIELARASKKHPPFEDGQAGLLVMSDIAEMAAANVFRDSPNDEKLKLLRSLIKLGAMAQRVAEDVCLLAAAEPISEAAQRTA